MAWVSGSPLRHLRFDGATVKVRARLVLAFFYILLVVIIALELPLAITMRARARAELETRTLAAGQLVAGQIGSENIHKLAALEAITQAAAVKIGGRIIVVDNAGNLVADSDGTDQIGSHYATSERPELIDALQGRPTTLIRHSTDLGTDLLAIATPIVDEVQVGALRITMPMAQVQANVRRTTVGLIGIGLAGLIAGLVIALALASSIARPLTRLAEVARRIGQGDLSARASSIHGAAEIDELARTFDDMATQVEASVQAERAFAHNASHQLRTPLTGLKLRLEAAIAAADDSEVRHQLEEAEAEADRLARIVTRLLPAQNSTTPGSTCDLAAVARTARTRFEARAARLNRTLTVVGYGPALVTADPLDIEQILDNLIDNALVHGGTDVAIEVAATAAASTLRVRDNGAGISEEASTHAWERFARGAQSKGSGLGLSIVKELAERWDGVAEIEGSGKPGACVTVTFPAAEPPVLTDP